VEEYTGTYSGTPKICDIRAYNKIEKSSQKVLLANYLSSPVKLDGISDEPCWRENSSSPLGFTRAKELALRAFASSEEEYQKMLKQNVPSWTVVNVAYDKEGLYILSQCNNVAVNNCLATHKDDDMNMWQDDCMEYLFQPANIDSEYYHCVVNVKGNRVISKNGSDVIRDDRFKTATKSPFSAGEGTSQEIFIPWRVFGLSSPPAVGSVWKFQAGREHHSWFKGEEILCWPQVGSQFTEMACWGCLVFSGSVGELSLKDIDMGSRYPGANLLKGLLVRKNCIKSPKWIARISNEKQDCVVEKMIDGWSDQLNMPFSLKYTVPQYSTDVTWTFDISDSAGKSLMHIPFSIPAVKHSVRLNRYPEYVVSGMPWDIYITLQVGNLELAGRYLEGVLISDAGDRINIPDIALTSDNVEQVAQVDLEGVAPGRWRFYLWIKGIGNEKNSDSVYFEMLPTPFASEP
jgi:hypothetical protein